MIVWKDADEAKIKWSGPEIRDEYLRKWIDDAERRWMDETLPEGYRLGYLISVLEAIKAHLIHTQQ